MPTLQQQAIKLTKGAVDMLFNNARHIPADKLDWQPMGEARSVMSQVIECAGAAYFFASVLKGEPMDMNDPAQQEKRKQFEASLTTIEAVEDAARKSHEILYSVIASVPDGDLDELCPMPWNPNNTKADIIFAPYWNLVYHIGQINYLQLMLGDTEMHA
jgi:hypothetical protein